jgi:hypothetical protein
MLNVWSQQSGYSLGVFDERTVRKLIAGQVDRRILLPILANADLTGVSFSVISGKLPAGLRLSGEYLIGSFYEVVRSTISTFVIRASRTVNGIVEISDRTFSITVDGADAPQWITEEGTLAVGVDPYRVADVFKVRRINNIVTLWTALPHEFVLGNKINVSIPLLSGLDSIDAAGVEFRRPGRLSRSSNFTGDSVTTEFVMSEAMTTDDILEITLTLNGNLISPIQYGVDSQRTTITFVSPPVNGADILVTITEGWTNFRIRNSETITYFKQGRDISESEIPGTVQLVKDPLTFVLDGTYIDFQLQASDTDLRASDELEYFIEDNSGQLPPGLSLSRNGRITGFIDPILALDVTARDGVFDSNTFDTQPYDFGIVPNIGIAGFENVITPRKLNRYYEFRVTVTDGETSAYRLFKIYVVGDDFLRADNTIMRIGDGTYSADSTYLRSPIWLSANNLGVKRANNYVSIILDTFDPNPEIGPIDYKLESINNDGTASILPPGLFLDSTNAEIFGFVPYQPAVTRDYKFTLSVTKYDKENLESVDVQIVIADDTPYGRRAIRINKLSEEDKALVLNDSVRIGTFLYTIVDYQTLPAFGYDVIQLNETLRDTLNKNFIISKTYTRELSEEFTTRKSSKTFNIQVLGEVDSIIQWITASNLGTVRANVASQLELQAETSVIGAELSYKLISGTLPPGVTLQSNGQLIGRITQFGNIVYRSFWRPAADYIVGDVVKRKDPMYTGQLYKVIQSHTSSSGLTPDNNEYWEPYTFLNNVRGLTTFDNRTASFDAVKGTLDRSYTFTVLASDQFKYSSITRRFTVYIDDPDVKLFSNIYAKPYPSQAKRDLYFSFINNLQIFTPDRIYRSSDPAFGVQSELKMLVYAGIETLAIESYISALMRNTKRKRFRLGNAKAAVAQDPGSNNVVYEVIYLEVFDEYEIGETPVSNRIKLNANSKSSVKVNQSRTNPVDGRLGTVNPLTGGVTYANGTVNSKLNQTAVERYRPATDPYSADMSLVKASGNSIEYAYPTSINNIRSNIKNISVPTGNTTRQIDTESSFLPQWMITPQNNRTAATGYIKAIPICYCKPGNSEFILQNINNSNFDFTQLDFEIDRFIIDSVSGESADQYLKFPSFKFNI